MTSISLSGTAKVAEADAEGEALASVDPRTQRAEAGAANARAALQRIRDQSGLAAKALGAIGTAATAGLGITQLRDIFPLAGVGEEWATLAIAGLVAALSGVLWVAAQFWRVQEPVATTTTTAGTIAQAGLRDNEAAAKDIKMVYGDAVRAARASDVGIGDGDEHDLTPVEQRGFALLDSADEKEVLLGQRLLAEITAAQARASVLVARRRATAALRGGSSILALAMVIVGLAAFVAATGYVEGERDGKVALLKSCGEAAEALKKGGLGVGDLESAPCDASAQADEPEEKPTAADALRTARANAVADSNACDKALGAGPGDSGDAACKALRERAAALAQITP